MSELDWHWLTLSQACQRLKSGQGSALELTRDVETCKRLGGTNTLLCAFARRRCLGNGSAGWTINRPLANPWDAAARRTHRYQGSVFTRGLPTASGTTVMTDFCLPLTPTVVTRLREAGAVLVGKTQLTEGAFGAHHPAVVPPLKPLEREAWTGVSSSGSGVAVAAGVAFAAIGSDTGGSIRFRQPVAAWWV